MMAIRMIANKMKAFHQMIKILTLILAMKKMMVSMLILISISRKATKHRHCFHQQSRMSKNNKDQFLNWQ